MRFSFDCQLGRSVDPLLFWLCFSGLLHALVIIFPNIGKTSNEESAVASGILSRRPPFSTTLMPAPRFVAAMQTAPRIAKELAPRADPAHEITSPAVNNRLDVLAEEPDFFSSGESNYFEASELAAKPQLLEEPKFESVDFSDIAASGRVVLVLRINALGDVIDAAVDSSDLPEVFSQSAVKAFQNLRFVPGELNGQKVGSVLRIEVRYDDDRLP